MESVWFKPELSGAIIQDDYIYEEMQSIIADMLSGHIDITYIVENMGGVLTDKEAENRAKGMRFFTSLLTKLPKEYLNEMQVTFISKFYIDRLKDNHRVLPAVLEGYLVIIDMKNYNIENIGNFFTILFREVACQSQVRQERYNIYSIIKQILDKEPEYMKSLGPDFVYGVISAIDGERDPRNLLFLFSFLPNFIANIPLGHLIEEMFEVVSCYYPIDFNPSPEDPTAVSRIDLATALAPCLCAIPDFGELCLVLLIEKLDSSLRVAKLDSLKLLTETCKTFKPETYGPFLKTLWSSIYREVLNKTDEELTLAAHEALSTLVMKLSSTSDTDQVFEGFVKGVLLSMQTVIAESTTVAQFVLATRVLLTTANASKESCLIIIKMMIPATIAYYGFKTSPKLQIASLDFLGDLYDMGKHWEILDRIDKQLHEIPTQCLAAVSQPGKERQIAGFKTLIRVQNVLETDLVVAFVEILIHNVQHAQDSELLRVSVETIHAIARKYPELIMNLVVKGKCDLDNLTHDDSSFQKRLNLLTNLASIDDFTKIIIEEMLKLISDRDKSSLSVVEALSESISNTSLYSDQKVAQIESDHGLIESILSWLFKVIKASSEDSLSHGYTLISNTVGSLPADKQQLVLTKHTPKIMELCKTDEVYFFIIDSMYSSIHQSVYDDKFKEIMSLSLTLSLNSDNELLRTKACVLVAHFLNKVEFGPKFELFYELLKDYLSSCNKDDHAICPRLITLYGWIAKSLIMRGSDLFSFWLQKITVALSSPEYCCHSADAVRIIMTDFPGSLTARQHCRVSLLYKQRMFQSFSSLADKLGPLQIETKESYLLCWAYVLMKAPKSVLNNQVEMIAPLVIDSLGYDHKDLLAVMLDVLHYFVLSIHVTISDSLQTILPRLVKLSQYVKSMDVRIKSLQCLYDIANSYGTLLLIPYKQDMLLDLAPSLDDRKRLVRNVAVKARTRWFLVGAPGEGKAS